MRDTPPATGDTQGTGMLSVHYGGSGGIYEATTETFSEDTTGYPGSVGWDEIFTYSLAAGDVNGNGYCDLAVGHPLDMAGDKPNSGTIRLMFGTPQRPQRRGHRPARPVHGERARCSGGRGPLRRADGGGRHRRRRRR
ncbi:FG-GAP repeat protein [Streptomyces sp. NPDC051740]|uniref:FG-GAP repeat protein n=1 Tax=Streptomyces sp. NPDC051740 TaxID=3365673 RepID=UPI00378A02ED